MEKFWFVMLDETVGHGSIQSPTTLPHVRHKEENLAMAEAERLAPEATTARLLCQSELLIDQRRFADPGD